MSKVQKKQFYDNSCGAAALLCAASELGITHLPEIPDTLVAGQELHANNSCESALYYLTYGASLGPRPIDYRLEKGGYSFPHNVVLAARIIGLDAEIYMENRYAAKALSVLYPRCEQLCAQSGITILRRPRPPLAPAQRALKIVGVMKLLALHYVMQRPDESYMDPADGKNFPTFGAMNDSWLKCYADTGISIVLRKG